MATFLFVSSGYPHVQDASDGSGIGTYVHEMCLGLTAKGHQCHVMAWKYSRIPVRTLSHPRLADPVTTEGVTVHLVPRSYRPILERFWPNASDSAALKCAVKHLDDQFQFDWIELQSEEGIGIEIQRGFPDKSLLGIHTTLEQMREHKAYPLVRTARRRIVRERRSIRIAGRIIAHSTAHARELMDEYALPSMPTIIPFGVDFPDRKQPPYFPGDRPRFVVVGTPDRRKGFDRLRPLIVAYGEQFGPCQLTIISAPQAEAQQAFGPLDGLPATVEVLWKQGLTREELFTEYAQATALLHVARYESFGIPLIEAAAMGTPVLATPTGIAEDLLESPLEECLLRGSQPIAWAAALHQTWLDRDSMSRAIKKRYEEAFTRTRMVEHYLEVLEGWEKKG